MNFTYRHSLTLGKIPEGFRDENFVLALAEATGVIATPGSYYGCRGFIRLSYGMLNSMSETAAAAELICNFLSDVTT